MEIEAHSRGYTENDRADIGEDSTLQTYHWVRS